MKPIKVVKWVALVFVAELAREWYVLRCMGFEPGRFIGWVKQDEL